MVPKAPPNLFGPRARGAAGTAAPLPAAAHGAPAAMVKITPEAVLSAPRASPSAASSLSLNARGRRSRSRVTADCVDLSDNEIAKLEGSTDGELSTLLVADSIAHRQTASARQVEGWTARTQSARLP